MYVCVFVRAIQQFDNFMIYNWKATLFFFKCLGD